MSRSRTANEIRKITARKSAMILLFLPLVLIVLSYWGSQRELRGFIQAQARGVDLARQAYEEGTFNKDQLTLAIQSYRGSQRLARQSARLLAFPASIQFGFQVLGSAGSMFVGLAAVLTFGSEFGWGTLRNRLATGRSRRTILADQLIAFLFVSGGLLGGVILVSAALGLLESYAIHTSALRFHSEWLGILASFAGAVLTVLVWIAIGCLFAVLMGRTLGVSVAAVSVFWVVIVLASIQFPVVRDWSIEMHAITLLLFRSPQLMTGVTGFSSIGNFDPQLLPSVGRAVAYLSLLTIGFLAAAFRRFERVEIP